LPLIWATEEVDNHELPAEMLNFRFVLFVSFVVKKEAARHRRMRH